MLNCVPLFLFLSTVDAVKGARAGRGVLVRLAVGVGGCDGDSCQWNGEGLGWRLSVSGLWGRGRRKGIARVRGPCMVAGSKLRLRWGWEAVGGRGGSGSRRR